MKGLAKCASKARITIEAFLEKRISFYFLISLQLAQTTATLSFEGKLFDSKDTCQNTLQNKRSCQGNDSIGSNGF